MDHQRSCETNDLPPGLVRVSGKYRLQRKIASGSFGDVYHAKNVISGGEFAVKLEPVDADLPKLGHEWAVYKALGRGAGIPRVRWYGMDRGYRAIVMNLLGPSLEDLFESCFHRFSLKTVLQLADQTVSLVEYIHNHHFIHGDIKPENFLINLQDSPCQVNIIDFGLSHSYRNSITLDHIPYEREGHLVGTPRYASINGHRGIKQTRRDDLESLAYILIYFLRGSLPWQGLDQPRQTQKHRQIMKKKLATPSIDLCHGLPDEFRIFLDYARDLSFTDQPDYDYIRKLFRGCFVRLGYCDDGVFDWDRPTPKSVSVVANSFPNHA
ncbi:kinase-like domain-containing protein [Infundibulicybe gibba]|nr:kinase-like domain-containing protein [Infundibulicybe gibba]